MIQTDFRLSALIIYLNIFYTLPLTASQGLSHRPFVSTRGAAMSHALVSLADDLDASYYNPAGIGINGTDCINHLYLPLVGSSFNKQGLNLTSDPISQGSRNPGVHDALNLAKPGMDSYGRATGLTGIAVDHMILHGYTDLEVFGHAQDEDLTHVAYRQRQVLGGGFAIESPDKQLSVGVYSSFEWIEDGELSKDSTDSSIEETIFDQQRYERRPVHAGLLWILSPQFQPTLGVSVRDIAGTRAMIGDDEWKSNGEKKESTNIGFSLTFDLTSYCLWTFATTIEDVFYPPRLEDYRFGSEITLGTFGHNALFQIRSGYSAQGSSAGLALNLGLIRAEASLESIHSGDINPENRYSVLISVNAKP